MRALAVIVIVVVWLLVQPVTAFGMAPELIGAAGIFVGLTARRRAMISQMLARSVIVIGVLLALGLAGCRGEHPASAQDTRKPQAPPPREVRVVPAGELALPRTVVATGTLAAEEQVTLSAKVAGRIETIEVDLGTRVRRGQPMARLDQTDFKLRVEQAQAAAGARPPWPGPRGGR